MSNLGRKNGIYHVRFFFEGKEFKKSLKTRERSEAEAAKRIVELTIHRLLTGQLQLADSVEVGDFIVSGGSRSRPRQGLARANSTRQLVQQYLDAQKSYIAESTHSLFSTHLNHLSQGLGRKVDNPANTIVHRDLELHLQSRMAATSKTTAAKERRTIRHMFSWAVDQGYLPASPAANLPLIKCDEDRPIFRTHSEIEAILASGGLTEPEIFDQWECLFLSASEIANLLQLAQSNCRDPQSYLVHAIPAYTGMRRGEILRLTWADVDWERKSITARSRKQSRASRFIARRIGLHHELGEILREWKQTQRHGPYVLQSPQTTGQLNEDQANRLFWQPLRGTAWCLDQRRNRYKIGFHTYRHSFASNLAVASVDQRIIDEFMGHSTESMRRRYRHLFPQQRHAAVESFSFGGGLRQSA